MTAKKILVVESNQPIEGLSGALFRRRECVLEVASSGAEGLAAAERQPPDLVLLDALIEDLTPEEFVHALHSDRAGEGVPVIVVLGDDASADEARQRTVLAAGAAVVLHRPASAVELNVRVCDCLGISLRRHVRTFVKMKVDATVGAATHFATISNISLGGVLVQSDHPIALGEIIKLSFFLPGDDDPITTFAKVVREGRGAEKGYGCQFLDLPDASRERIHAFVTSAEGDEG
jgi:CheY-like chemotaxis protein